MLREKSGKWMNFRNCDLQKIEEAEIRLSPIYPAQPIYSRFLEELCKNIKTAETALSKFGYRTHTI